MTILFHSIVITALILSTIGQTLHGQNKSITFTNSLNAYYHKKEPKGTLTGRRFYAPTINEITLHPNATFEFWSRPDMSCFTWQNYKGTWKKYNDTLFFYNNYQVEENDIKVTYKRGLGQSFIITFRTDKCSLLKNKNIQVLYEYDYGAHINSPEKIFTFDANNSVVIPYKDIPHLDKLAAIRVEYLLNYSEKRYAYLTENKTVNVKQGDLPNIIDVEFVERPKKEVIYRTIKAVVKSDTLRILSIAKTKIILPDYHHDIEFEDSYRLVK